MSIEPREDFTTQQTIEDLQRARHLIAKGWCQGRAIMAGRWFFPMRFCTTGAVGEACGARDPFADEDTVTRATNATAALFKAICPGAAWGNFDQNCGTIVVWNDRAGRTKDDVLAAFDRAIASLRA